MTKKENLFPVLDYFFDLNYCKKFDDKIPNIKIMKENKFYREDFSPRIEIIIPIFLWSFYR